MSVNTVSTSNQLNTPETADGFQVGKTATSKVGFYGASPLSQPTNANQATLTDNTIGTASTILVALTGTYNSTLIVANIASLAAQTNAIQAALVSLGLIKGA